MIAADRTVEVRRHQITGGAGVRLAYTEYLPHGTVRADVLLVHGLASAGLQFEADAMRFARLGYRVLVPDLRGHGASGVPAGAIRTDDFSIAVMAADAIAILDHAGASDVHWVGNSLGGILALFLLGTPQAERIRSLALFGTCFSMDLPPLVASVLRLAFLPGAKITSWLTALSTTRSPAGRRAVALAIRQFNVAAGAAIASHVRHYDFIANAQAFTRPILVLRGGRDRAVNLRLGQHIGKFSGQPSFARVDLPTGGHCANLDVPDEFAAALLDHWSRAEADAGSTALPLR